MSYLWRPLEEPSVQKMVLNLPQGHKDSEYVLSHKIGQRENGFYSARTDRRTEPPMTVLVYRFVIEQNLLQLFTFKL